MFSVVVPIIHLRNLEILYFWCAPPPLDDVRMSSLACLIWSSVTCSRNRFENQGRHQHYYPVIIEAILSTWTSTNVLGKYKKSISIITQTRILKILNSLSVKCLASYLQIFKSDVWPMAHFLNKCDRELMVNEVKHKINY